MYAELFSFNANGKMYILLPFQIENWQKLGLKLKIHQQMTLNGLFS